ncbi:hypothetical protein BDA96_07G100800 [Sorghum bicolor]|jgi:hypothetical protein|uniref:Uncharacterized protein n=1 Tax=Sorghum bicolor TaxID=4558 RepID=A0A921QJ90_SORBI|nr:hypothetical protein BDA96_07G100800 [Sorghum bicolor]
MIYTWFLPPLLQSHHTKCLLTALPAPETDPSQHLHTSKVSLLYLAHINCLLSNNALPTGYGSLGRRFLGTIILAEIITYLKLATLSNCFHFIVLIF